VISWFQNSLVIFNSYCYTEEAHREKIRKQVAGYVHSQLKMKVKEAAEKGGKMMSRDECSRIEGKVSAKVVEGSTSLGAPGDKEEKFMTSKRKEKIKILIESYLAQGKGGKGAKPTGR
jgi:hypothetical protein